MSYTHLTQQERYEISHQVAAGWSMAAIARNLGRSKGTISRELSRNAQKAPAAYWGDKAHDIANARQNAPRTPYKLCPGPLLDEVQLRLLSHHSPEEIAGRLKLDFPDDPTMHITTEAIYLWIYRQTGPRWHSLLRKCHCRRKPQRRGIPAKQGQIIGRVGIENRPPQVNQRTHIGDWESDTICGEPGTGGVASHVERVSRFIVITKVDDRSARQYATQSVAAFKRARIAVSACRTLTADNGKEFAEFVTLEKGLGFKVYFANPHAPWERGTNENTNGLLRQYFLKGSDFRKLTSAKVDAVAQKMNNRPRKCLGYQTPREVLVKLRGVALQI